MTTTHRPMIEPTRPYSPDTDRLRHHYLADTAEPFDVAEEISIGALTVNHAHAKAERIAGMSEGYAPGPPILPRRRISLASLLSGIAAVVFVALAIVGAVVMLGAIAP